MLFSLFQNFACDSFSFLNVAPSQIHWSCLQKQFVMDNLHLKQAMLVVMFNDIQNFYKKEVV